jgi:hypothetical protein
MAETWPGIPSRLRAGFSSKLLSLLGLWFQRVHMESAAHSEAALIAIDLLQNVKTNATALLRALEKIVKAPEQITVKDPYWPGGSRVAGKSREFFFGRKFAENNLRRAGETATPAWNIADVMNALAGMVEVADKPTVQFATEEGTTFTTELNKLIRVATRHEHRKSGRPSGIARHRGLDFLVYELAVIAIRAGISLTAYTKNGGGIKVAAGSLIDMLDMLREAVQQQISWDTQLPLLEQHQRQIATYQRLLARARSHISRKAPSRKRRHSSKSG